MDRDGKAFTKPQRRSKASTSEILGPHARNGKPPPKWAGHHAQLIRMRDHLAGQRRDRAASSQAEPATTGEHMADAATDSFDRDWALAMASSDQSVLYEVDQALKRIADGSYGRCELTGKPIEADRLKALPWTRFCAAAQAELEAHGAAARPHLGRLGSCSSMPTDNAQPDEDDLEAPSTERSAA